MPFLTPNQNSVTKAYNVTKNIRKQNNVSDEVFCILSYS